MREIKFRAWDKMLLDTSKRSRMFEVYGLNTFTNYVSAYKETGDEVVHDLRDCILMQFTGLLDKQGKEIYEGDIANITFYIHGTPITERGVMEFTKEAYFGFKVENSLFNDRQGNLDIEVIGNIYENPEILTVPLPEAKGGGCG